MTRTRTFLWSFLIVAALAAGGCSDGGGSGAAGTTLDVATLASPGPYAVGEAELVLVDTSRPTQAIGEHPGAPERTLPTRIWYPATSAGKGAAPSADGPFPIIGWAHGFASANFEGQYVGAHLASHGYVVVGPTFPLSNGGAPGGPTIADMTNQPADLDFVMRQVTAGAAGDGIAAAIDDTRRGIAGLSLGGGTVLIGAYHPTWHIENVSAALALAPASCFFGSGLYAASIPMLIITGDADMLVPIDSGPTQAFDWADAPIELIALHGGNHVGFLGIEGQGGHNPDATIGCPVIGSGGSIAASGIGTLSTLLQEGVGPSAFDASTCLSSCMEELPSTMPPARQLDITRAAALAHFDAVLRGDRAKARWLEKDLATQTSDLAVSLRR
jgi:predicted dienelactone hydrolase